MTVPDVLDCNPGLASSLRGNVNTKMLYADTVEEITEFLGRERPGSRIFMQSRGGHCNYHTGRLGGIFLTNQKHSFSIRIYKTHRFCSACGGLAWCGWGLPDGGWWHGDKLDYLSFPPSESPSVRVCLSKTHLQLNHLGLLGNTTRELRRSSGFLLRMVFERLSDHADRRGKPVNHLHHRRLDRVTVPTTPHKGDMSCAGKPDRSEFVMT